MNKYKEVICSLSGDKGEVWFEGKKVAKIEGWSISIFQEVEIVKTFEGISRVPLQKCWNGTAYITPDPAFNPPSLQGRLVRLRLFDSEDNKKYEVEAVLSNIYLDNTGNAKVEILGSGEFPLDLEKLDST